MYSIFFHLLGISLLEILFYFFYIGPYETEMYIHSMQETMDNMIDNQTELKINKNMIDYVLKENNLLINNTTITEYMNNVLQSSNDIKNNRIIYNDNLFTTSMMCWGGVFLFISICYISTRCYKYKYNSDNKNDKENVIKILQVELQDMNDLQVIETVNIVKEINHHDNTNWYEIIHYFLFASLLIVFEYLFFKFVVLKYNVVSNQELKYLFVNNSYKYLKNKIILQ